MLAMLDRFALCPCRRGEDKALSATRGECCGEREPRGSAARAEGWAFLNQQCKILYDGER